jgi:DNA polymerase sigma
LGLQFLKERNMHAAYTGGLSSYCLVLLITAFLQQQHALQQNVQHCQVLVSGPPTSTPTSHQPALVYQAA